MRRLLLILFFIPVLAVPIHQIDIQLNGDSFIETIKLSGVGSRVSFGLPPGDLQLLSSNSPCELGSDLRCQLTGDSLEARILVRNAKSAGYIISHERGKMFRFSYSPAEQSQVRLRVMLPAGATFSSKPFSFPAAEIKTDGQVIYAEWNLQSSGGEESSFFLLYNEPSNYLWLFGLVLVAAGSFIFMKSREVGKERVIKVLSEDERKVHGMISSHRGEMDQKQLVNETGWSKSKVSQIVRNLEEMEILSKKIKGRKNLIRLRV